MFDEVQTGFGRTGEMFASQTFGVTPDISTYAKAVAGGFPMGVVMASNDVSDTFVPGDHAATFGGSPLACAAAKASINYIIDENLIQKSKENGLYFMKNLEMIKEKNSIVKEVRGKGLMIGMELFKDCGNLVDELRERGIIINCAAGNVLRFVPPLVISKTQIDTVISALDDAITSFN